MATGASRVTCLTDARLGLYKQLWQREKHWRAGDAQSIAILSGHKSYVTSLALHGETMISGSYDDTWVLLLCGATADLENPCVAPPVCSGARRRHAAPAQSHIGKIGVVYRLLRT